MICSIEKAVYVNSGDGDSSLEWVKREGVANFHTESEKAFLRAYQAWGFEVNEMAIAEQQIAPAPQPATPKQYERSAAPRAEFPVPKYEGPTPWRNDNHADIDPIACVAPPDEPEWFSQPMKWWCKKRYGEMTWGEAVRAEVENPGGRDQALGYVRWCIEARDYKPSDDPEKRQAFERAHRVFIGRGKAALIWWLRAMDSAPGASYEQESKLEDTPF